MKQLTWNSCAECPYLEHGPTFEDARCRMGVDRKSAGLNEIPPGCYVPDAPLEEEGQS